MMKRWGAALAAVGLVASPVQANCWNAEDAAAASVRELQTMLMVATLRCHAAGQDISADYNTFLRANKSTIIGINDRLKAHFIKAGGPVVGQRDYDSFTTSMANGYGAHSSSPEVCASAASIEREAGLMAGSIEALVMVADREAMAVDLPGGHCEGPATMTMASASATRGIVAAVQQNATPAIASRGDGTPSIARGAIAAIRGNEDQAGQTAMLAYIPGQ